MATAAAENNDDDYADVPTDIRSIMGPAQRLFARRLQMLESRTASLGTSVTVELELRLGRETPQGFRSGVDEDFFQTLEGSLCAFGGWTSADKDEVASYAYAHSGNMRTTTTYPGPVVTHMRKTRDSEFFGIHTSSDDKSGGQQRLYDIRVSLNSEKTILPHELPTHVEPTLVRIRRRRSFVLDGIWRFDLTRAWSGNTRSDAENRLATQPPDYEVEIEYLASLSQSKHETRAHAYQLLLHMASLYDHYDPRDGRDAHRFTGLEPSA